MSILLEVPETPADAPAAEPNRSLRPEPPPAVREVDQRWEFLDGAWVRRSMGKKSSMVGTRLCGRLLTFAEGRGLGQAFNNEMGYRVVPDQPRKAYYPDGSFVQRDRLALDRSKDGPMTIPPDLAFEVVSPNDEAEELNLKVEYYLLAGTRLVWVLYPATRTIHVFRPDGTARRLTVADDLSGEDVLPGFTCKAAELFAGV
jgi:Uma2 family endonuclease